MKSSVLFLLSMALLGQTTSPHHFVPARQIPGIGVARDDLSDETLAARTDLMIQTQTNGIMQVSEATARVMGLNVTHATRYRVTRERVQVKSKSKKPKFKTVTRKDPYTVTVRDDRLNPDRAIPAAAAYLAGMEQKFGGRDWAIFA